MKKGSEEFEREQGAYMGWFGRKKGKKKYSTYKLNTKMKNAKQEKNSVNMETPLLRNKTRASVSM